MLFRSLLLALVTLSISAPAIGLDLTKTLKETAPKFEANVSKSKENVKAETARRAEQERLRKLSKRAYTDFYNACLGVTQYESNCYSIKSPDLKNLCIGRSKRDEGWCYAIKNPDIKNLCLGISVSKYKDFCYNVQNKDIKNTCLAASTYKYRDFCYSVKSEPWRSFCAGMALADSNCYNLN